jgi:acylphosphatase
MLLQNYTSHETGGNQKEPDSISWMDSIRNTMSTSPANNLTTFHLVIHGRVQGVFFRDSMRREAQRLALTGWVRNTADGTVEAMVQGEQSAMDRIVQWAHRGPAHAQVSNIEVKTGSGTFHQFEILY